MKHQSTATQETFVTRPRTQTTKKPSTKHYLRLKDRVELMQKCGDAALILYEFYISKSGISEYSFSDQKASEALKWSTHKVKKNRLRLQKHNFFYQEKGKLANNKKIRITYLCPNEIVKVKEEAAGNKDIEETSSFQSLLSNLSTSNLQEIGLETDELGSAYPTIPIIRSHHFS